MRMIAALILTLMAPGCGSARPGGGSPPSPATAVPTSQWTLAWSDEFDGPAGSLVDATRWIAEVGGHGWGNNELEYYTERSQNASLSGDGLLVIRALREHYVAVGGDWPGSPDASTLFPQTMLVDYVRAYRRAE